ncbi:MAG: hypothetical protein Q9221_008700 [Calogaya cf. arnoldii]
MKSHVSSVISCTLPADSVSPVPALLIILSSFFNVRATAITKASGTVHSHVQSSPYLYSSLHHPFNILSYRRIRFNVFCLSLAVLSRYQFVGRDAGFHDPPISPRIGAKIGADDGGGAIGREGEGDGAAKSGRSACDDGAAGCESVGEQWG